MISPRTELTHLCLAFHKQDRDQACKSKSDATECGVWSGPKLFAFRTGIAKNVKVKTNHGILYSN